MAKETNSKIKRSEKREIMKAVNASMKNGEEKPPLNVIERWIVRQIINSLLKYIDNMKGSWKTTLGGAIGALGTFLSTQMDPPWLSIVGNILTGLGMFLMGASARDNSVTSEEAGAK